MLQSAVSHSHEEVHEKEKRPDTEASSLFFEDIS